MDAAALARENALLKARLTEVEAALAESQEANRRLEDILRTSQREKFGKRSEKLSPDQFNLALEDAELAQGVLEAAQEKAEAALRGKNADMPHKPARNRGHLPPHLPRVERVIEPASTLCPCGCGEMARIGEDVSERLDVIPAQFRVLVTRRPKYACRRCSQAVAQAHVPEHVVPGGLPTELFIASIIVSKFGDHLPFGPDGPKHPGNRQLPDTRGSPDAGARLSGNHTNPKVATFCAALWLTFTLPLTSGDRLRVHHLSAEQCQPPKGTVGLLASVFIEGSGGGQSLRELVTSIETALAGDDKQILKVQETIAETLGDSLPSAMGARFDDRRALSSIRFFDLTQVPAIRIGVPPEVSGVHFRSDLSRTVALSYRDVLAMSEVASKFIPK